MYIINDVLPVYCYKGGSSGGCSSKGTVFVNSEMKTENNH